MKIARVPVVVWSDGDGRYTACLVGDSRLSGYGATAAEAVRQIKEFLAWITEEHTWTPPVEFAGAELVRVSVGVRPEYRVKERVFPAEGVVKVRVPCVHYPAPGGMRGCVMPLLGVQFYYHDEKSLRQLVRHYAREVLAKKTPRQLTRSLPPRSLRLEELVVRMKARPRASTAVPAPALEAVADPMASRGWRGRLSKPYGRDAQVEDLARRLGEERASVLVVGGSGSGKTTVLAEVARRSARPLWMTSAGRLIAGMKYLGQWQARCEEVVADLSRVEGVLCAENLLDLVRVGGQGPSASLAAFLGPFVERGEVQLVVEATPEELDACRRLLPGFADLFQVVTLPEFTDTEAREVLALAAGALRVPVSDAVPALVQRLFRRFRPYDAFPGKPAGLLRSAAERGARLTPEVVLDVFSRDTGLPQALLRDDLPLDPQGVLDWFRAEILGQEEACRAAASVVVTFKAGMNDPLRPLGTLLLCGPTGVGKTETAKALGRYLFGHEDRVVRLDMSEYAGPGAASRLLEGDAVARVRRQPFNVVLFDEIEKADPEVFDLLLGVLDEGRLTDAWGRVTRFHSTVLLLTSNLGSAATPLGLTQRSLPSYEAEAMAFFRPEFFNRLDRVVRYGPLARDVVLALTRRELGAVAAREGLAAAGLRLTWSAELEELLAQEGYDPRYGARPLQRAVERRVVAPLARFLVDEPGLRDREVRVEVVEGEVIVG